MSLWMFSLDRVQEIGIWPSVAVVVALSVAVRFLLTAAYKVFFSELSAIPGPIPAKFLSAYLQPALIRGERAQALLKLHQKYGPVVRVGPNEVSISDWTAYRDIYGGKASTKENSFYATSVFLSRENIFSMRNKKEHAARRKLESQPYSQQAVIENEGLIAEKAKILIRRIIGAAAGSASGKTVDVFTLCGLFGLEVICKCAFNRDFGETSDGGSLDLLTAMDRSAQLFPILAVMPFLKSWGIGRHLPGSIGTLFRGFDTWVSSTRSLVDSFQQHENALDKTQRFMATPLLTNRDDFLGRQLTPDEVIKESMGIAFAGSGTTSTTLVYLLYAMARPELQDRQLKLHEEVNLAGDSLQEVKDLPYLNAVIKETMRLYPTIISTLPRILDSQLAVGRTGFVLPAGTQVGMQNYVHHRDPTVFAEPDQFIPERWLEDSVSDMNNALTPFSVGSRNCIGQNLAKAELYLAVSKILRQLRISLNPTMTDWDMVMEDRFNIAPKSRRLVLDIDVLG